MFNIVKTPVDDQCSARRCKGVPDERGPGATPLCEKHLGEWLEAGSPEFGAKDPGYAPVTDMVHVEEPRMHDLAQESRKAQEYVELVKALGIETQDGVDMLGEVGQHCRDRVKELEAERKTATGPINLALETINGWFRPVTGFYKECITITNGRLLEAKRLAEAAQDQALDAIEADGGHVDETTLVVAHTPVDLPTGASTRRVVAWEITDPDLLPRELLSPDPAKLKTFAAAALPEGITEAPGVRFFYEEKISQRHG